MELFILPAARAIRDYSEETGDHKIVSTAGLSPSRNCKEWYDVQLESPELMGMTDNFALNLSDFNNGWGGGLLTWVGSVWDQMEYMDERLNEEGYLDKGIAAESWICWDGKRPPWSGRKWTRWNQPCEYSGNACEGIGLANLPRTTAPGPWSDQTNRLHGTARPWRGAIPNLPVAPPQIESPWAVIKGSVFTTIYHPLKTANLVLPTPCPMTPIIPIIISGAGSLSCPPGRMNAFTTPLPAKRK